MDLSIKVQKNLLDFSLPKVMAIVNITPDSFYTSWGEKSVDDILKQIQNFIDLGADIIDIGACSTRPYSTPINAEEEWKRLYPVLTAVRSHFPNAILSIDTFRAEIAEKAILAGGDIINDVYGGEADQEMWKTVAKYRIPYILTLTQDLPKDSEKNGYNYTISGVIDFFQKSLDKLHRMGVADVILDPGFGFAKTEKENYTILNKLDILSELHAPVLVGISRKSMLYKPLGLNPSDVLPATIAANTLALERGANILRVHDVAAAKQAIAIYSLMHRI